MKLPFWQVGPEWAGETVAILGGGPSLTQSQVDACRGRCRVIAVNNAYQLAPWADLLYFSDEVWWLWHHGGDEIRAVHGRAVTIHQPGDRRYREFKGLKVALSNAGTFRREPAVRILQNYEAQPGLCEIRDGVYTGRSSGYQAINLAAHLGGARILLLGFDMRPVAGRTHWHTAHQRPTAAQDIEKVMLPWFQTLVEPCRRRGIEIVNCTPGSAIECFPRASIADAFGASVMADFVRAA